MKKCQRCGAQMEDSVKFCTKCGQQIEDAEKHSTESEQFSKEKVNPKTPVKKKRKKAIIIIISILLIVALLIAGTIIIFFVPRKTNLRLSDLKDMNAFQVRLLLGKPDNENNDGIYYYDGRVTFYGYKVGGFNYDKNSHDIMIYATYDSKVNDSLLSYAITSRCELEKFGYFGLSYYKYNDINVTVFNSSKDNSLVYITFTFK